MTTARRQAWKTAQIPASKILLDVANPRVEISPQAAQKTIRRLLVETEDVVGLARDIVAMGGLLKGERVIVVKEGKDYVVLEGNRRVCACQILLDPSLAPPGSRGSFPLADTTLGARIASLEADVAPSREAAEAIITRRHTAPGIRQWSPIAKQRRIVKLVSQGRSIVEIADEFSMKRTEVLKTLQKYHLLEYVRRLKCWDDAAEAQLSAPDLRPTTFLRFFTMKGVKPRLQISFDDDSGKVSSTLPCFADAMELLAREMLLVDAGTKKTRSTTRTPTEDVFRRAFEKHRILRRLVLNDKTISDGDRTPQDDESEGQSSPEAPNGTHHIRSDFEDSEESPSANDATSRTPSAETRPTVAPKGLTSKRPDKFFENLNCPIQDNKLILLTREIRHIRYREFPAAATFLLRALLEATLQWVIDSRGLRHDLMREYFADGMQGRKKPEPGLDFVIGFLIKRQHQIFTGNVQNLLKRWQDTHKGYCDLVIHGRWIEPSAAILEEAAKSTRLFISKVFDGTALLPQSP